MDFAVIKTGGKQYKVREQDTLKIEKISGEQDSDVVFDHVLFVGSDDGKTAKVGNPTVSGAKVSAKITDQGRDRKVTVVKYKSKTRYKKTAGHRQTFTRVRITKIS